MRRFARFLLVLTLLLGVLAPVPARAQVADFGFARFATASWRPNGGRSPIVYIADAFFLIDPAGGELASTYVFVTRGPCQDQRTERFVIASCITRGVGGEVPTGQFTMDREMTTAHAEVKAGRWLHTIDWTGRGSAPPPVIYAGGLGETSTFIGASMSRDALAAGRLFGVKLKAVPDRTRFTMMSMDLGASDALPAVMARLGITVLSDGTVEIRRTFRTPVRPDP
jgi:hypothetical protein